VQCNRCGHRYSRFIASFGRRDVDVVINLDVSMMLKDRVVFGPPKMYFLSGVGGLQCIHWIRALPRDVTLHQRSRKESWSTGSAADAAGQDEDSGYVHNVASARHSGRR
jgi:hypothetical protein